MASDTNFFKNYAHRIQSSVHVAAPARVIKVHGEKAADVVILYKEDGEEGTPILRVPVLRHVVQSVPLVVGDVVLLNFADKSIENMNGSRSFEPEENEMIHRISDAVIVGVF